MTTIKTFTITQTTENGKTTMNRVNDGFSVWELIGILEFTQMDIAERFANDKKPDVIERKAIINEEDTP